MKKHRLRMVILTRGTEGSSVYWKDGGSHCDTPKVRVRSAVGAGDAFTGAFIGSLLNGRSVEDAHKTAVKVAAYVCTRVGAMPRVPERLFRT